MQPICTPYFKLNIVWVGLQNLDRSKHVKCRQRHADNTNFSLSYVHTYRLDWFVRNTEGIFYTDLISLTKRILIHTMAKLFKKLLQLLVVGVQEMLVTYVVNNNKYLMWMCSIYHYHNITLSCNFKAHIGLVLRIL